MTDLGIALHGRGRRAEPAAIMGVRELERDDLVALAEPRSTKPAALKRVSERHHAAARFLAQGVPPGVVAAIVGLRSSRISQLQADPLFQATMALYREETAAQIDTFMEALRGLSGDALAELANRLDEVPEGFENKELMELLKLTADRTGYGRVERQEVQIDMGERLAAARDRARAAVIEGEVV